MQSQEVSRDSGFTNFTSLTTGVSTSPIGKEDLSLLATPPVITNSPIPPYQQERNKEEIEQLTKERGFPELIRSWDRFKGLKIELSDLNPEQLKKARTTHCAPLGSHPILSALAVLSTGAAIGIFHAASILTQTEPTFLKELTAYSLSILNLTFLTFYTATWIRRKMLSSFEDIMGREVGYLLSKRDLRSDLLSREPALSTRKQISELFSPKWDDPTYSTYYQRKGDSLLSKEKQSPSLITLECLKELIGGKDPQTRKHTPGRLASSLRQGKKSINLLIERCGKSLSALKQDNCSMQECKDLLEFVRDHLVIEKSVGHQVVLDTMNRLEGKIVDGEWRADIWKRDPIVDLTHQEEFYSSASLRGVKAIGRGIKGRLGTFLYQWSPGVTMLDISSSKGRVIRARLIAGTASKSEDTKIPAILVDGVEGSTAVPRDVIHTAIRDYASSLNCPLVIYNANALNQVPRRFASYVGKKGVPIRETTFTALDQEERLYLDSFGAPLEPFEYAYAKGSVIGYCEGSQETLANTTNAPSYLTMAQKI